MSTHKWRRRILWSIFLLFIMVNVVAIFQGYRFTHFIPENKNIAKSEPTQLDKIKTLVLGVEITRPENTQIPTRPYQTLKIKSNKILEAWYIPVDSAKGTILMFHGYVDTKSSLLEQSNLFNQMGYNTLLVDFQGSGGSEGNVTTIGFKESEEVKSVFDYVQSKGEKNIYLYGVSMGAVAIMKSIHDYNLTPKGNILECPFGSMYQTVCARFHLMGVPTFPLAGILVFWGGIENGFWAFGFNPTEYAKDIQNPTLLIWGGKDVKVSRQETDEIYQNLQGGKTLKIYPNAPHADYLTEYKSEWIQDVDEFLVSTHPHAYPEQKINEYVPTEETVSP